MSEPAHPSTSPDDPLACPVYGDGSTTVVALHGGPGAQGDLASLAQSLGGRYTVLEPWQRRAGGTPLTVSQHVHDLDQLLAERCAHRAPILLGHSWGAMLALAHGAAFPRRAAALVLVGCGCFDAASRAELERRRQASFDEVSTGRLEQIQQELGDADLQLAALGCLFSELDGVDLWEPPKPLASCDAQGNKETWDDMKRCMASGQYPAAFRAIDVPVLMLHGAQDAHPGQLIRDGLLPHLPQLEFVEWPRCGHSPWRERGVSEQFFETIHRWIASLGTVTAG